ncbi:ParH-like protein [Kitasatospora sp. NPDC052896]|uniref:ParH-like protein n=1 Tax=Kitasatospora sp. NPDC052896 TaxID=3364061 RepID=UPI0037C9FE1E
MRRDGDGGGDGGTERERRRLWRRCRRIVDALDLPHPFDAAVFVARLAERRGRPIRLIPVTARPNIPCGLLVTTDEADCILYSADTTALHQQHILLHEAAHLVCGHHETSAAASAAAEVLLPHLPAALMRRVLGRAVYTEPQEREAELVASLILSDATRRAAPGAGGPAPRSWMESVFGVSGGARDGGAGRG